MKKSIWIFVILQLFLVGCSKKPVVENVKPIVDPPHTPIVKEQDIASKILTINPGTFHFVVGWLSETEIIYVEKDSGFYQVNGFDTITGKIRTLYQDKSIIVDALIHPSQKYFLLHTSKDTMSATIKLLSLDGSIKSEVEVASSELAIEWNDKNPSLILLTAFYRDWSFDLFMYNDEDMSLSILPIEDPFPKWLNSTQIIYGQVGEHELEGADLLTFSPSSQVQDNFKEHSVIYFDTYIDSILIVKMNEEGDTAYSIKNKDGQVISEWTLPAISNYSEWIIPSISWISEDTVLLTAPESGGQLDEIDTGFRLLRVSPVGIEVINKDAISSSLKCSPMGKLCLMGQATEFLINMDTGEKRAWYSKDE